MDGSHIFVSRPVLPFELCICLFTRHLFNNLKKYLECTLYRCFAGEFTVYCGLSPVPCQPALESLGMFKKMHTLGSGWSIKLCSLPVDIVHTHSGQLLAP